MFAYSCPKKTEAVSAEAATLISEVLSAESRPTARVPGMATEAASTRQRSSAISFFFMLSSSFPYAAGQPAASSAVSPLLAVCTASAFTSMAAVLYWYSLLMVWAKVTVVNRGSVVSPGFRARL